MNNEEEKFDLESNLVNLHEKREEEEKRKERNVFDFPVEVMTGAAGDFSYQYASKLESPQHFFYMAYLTCLGNLLCRKVRLDSEINQEPRLYTVLLGESADDRKSTAIHKTIEFFRDSVLGFQVCYGVGSAEGLAKRLENDKSVLLVYDELKAFISKSKIEGSVLLSAVNSLYELTRYESITKTHDIRLDEAHLSLLGASTVDTYQNTWDAAFTDIGFNNRLFIVPGKGEKKNPFPEKIPEYVKESLRTKLANVLKLVGEGKEIKITKEAKDIYGAWYKMLPRSIHSKRLDTFATRTMGLLAVNDLKEVIDRQTAVKAIKLADWQFAVRRVHSPINADNPMAKAEGRIRAALAKRPMSTRDLQVNVHYTRIGINTFNNALKNLEASEEIRYNRETKTWQLTEKAQSE